MSDEQQSTEGTSAPAETQNTESARPVENSGESSAPKEQNPSGYEQVDLTPAQQERFNRLYGQVKAQDRKISEYRTIAEQQARAIDELSKVQNQVATRIVDQDFSKAEDDARAAAQMAYNKGDSSAFLAANERIAEIKAQKILSQTLRQQPPQNQPNQQRVQSAQQAAQYAEGQGALNSDETMVVSAWQDERDENGNSLRPWSKDTDPNFMNALAESRAVFTNPRFANKSITEKLAEVDRRMGVVRSQANQTVMGANLTTQKKTNRMTLSPEIEKLAVRTKFGGPKAKSDQDHIDAYRKQLERVKTSTRGASR